MVGRAAPRNRCPALDTQGTCRGRNRRLRRRGGNSSEAGRLVPWQGASEPRLDASERGGYALCTPHAAMEALDYEVLGNSALTWLTAAGIALAVMALVRIVRKVTARKIEPLVKRTRFAADDIIVGTLEDTKWFFSVAFGIWAGARVLTLPDWVDATIGTAVVLLVLLQAGIWGQSIVRRSVARWTAKQGETPGQTTIAAALGFVLRLAVWAVVLLLVLANLGVEISGLVAGLGIGGVAAALAVQNVLGDLFASLSIYFDRPFDLGDFIIVDDYMGNVDRIGMRSTRIRSLGGEQIVFANSDLARSRIRNYRRMQERRIVLNVGVIYGTAHDKVKRIPTLLRESVEETDQARFDRAHFSGFADSSLAFEVVYYVLSADYTVYMDVQQEILLGIHRRFEENEIEFAFPTRTLHLEGKVLDRAADRFFPAGSTDPDENGSRIRAVHVAGSGASRAADAAGDDESTDGADHGTSSGNAGSRT